MSLTDFWTQTDAQQNQAAAVIQNDPRLTGVYQQALTLESWRRRILENTLGPGLPFWYEAQNDFLLAIVHAGHGVWRSSLHALRSFLENGVSAIYYSEHPVEAKRFATGEFRLTWAGSKDYISGYPYDSPPAFRRALIESLENEYAELSKGVHGSAEAFRMTASQQFPTLTSSEQRLIGSWKTRAIKCGHSIQLLLLQHYRPQLLGARLPALRDDIGRAFTPRMRASVTQSLGVVLPAP